MYMLLDNSLPGAKTSDKYPTHLFPFRGQKRTCTNSSESSCSAASLLSSHSINYIQVMTTVINDELRCFNDVESLQWGQKNNFED